jgi:hypothetical protein
MASPIINQVFHKMNLATMENHQAHQDDLVLVSYKVLTKEMKMRTIVKQVTDRLQLQQVLSFLKILLKQL